MSPDWYRRFLQKLFCFWSSVLLEASCSVYSLIYPLVVDPENSSTQNTMTRYRKILLDKSPSGSERSQPKSRSNSTKSFKRHKKESHVSKWTLALHFCAFSVHCIISIHSAYVRHFKLALVTDICNPCSMQAILGKVFGANLEQFLN